MEYHMMNHTEERFRAGSWSHGSPGKLIELPEDYQPKGHWIDADEKVLWPEVRRPGILRCLLVQWLLHRRWINYGSRPFQEASDALAP